MAEIQRADKKLNDGTRDRVDRLRLGNELRSISSHFAEFGSIDRQWIDIQNVGDLPK
jgi:hypothetical protein